MVNADGRAAPGKGVSARREVETTLRVRYAETDAMGVVYHANYLIWFEVGRGEYFRAMGQDYAGWEAKGFQLPVSEAYARYHSGARYSEEVTVRTWVEQVRSRALTLGYEVLRTATGERLATGWTGHLCIDSTGQARRLPAEILAGLKGT